MTAVMAGISFIGAVRAGEEGSVGGCICLSVLGTLLALLEVFHWYTLFSEDRK